MRRRWPEKLVVSSNRRRWRVIESASGRVRGNDTPPRSDRDETVNLRRMNLLSFSRKEAEGRYSPAVYTLETLLHAFSFFFKEACVGLQDDDEATGRREGLGLTRRQFLRGVASGAGAVGLGALDPFARLDARAKGPTPERSGMDHVVVVMMENRSFDHYLGWLPAADGRQAGLSYTDAAGCLHPTHPLAPDFQGCGHPDPDHSFAGGRVEYNNGACDGWLRAGANDAYAIGYYEANDLSFFRGSAVDWTKLLGPAGADPYHHPLTSPTRRAALRRGVRITSGTYNSSGIQMRVVFANERRLVKMVCEDWKTNFRDWTLPGFRALAVHRFGNWVQQLRWAPVRVVLRRIYTAMFRYVRNKHFIELPVTASIGRRVVIGRHSGIVVHQRGHRRRLCASAERHTRRHDSGARRAGAHARTGGLP